MGSCSLHLSRRYTSNVKQTYKKFKKLTKIFRKNEGEFDLASMSKPEIILTEPSSSMDKIQGQLEYLFINVI